MEEALYETTPFRQFAGLSLDGALPDRTTIMNFRHLLEKHQLGREIFAHLRQGLVSEGFTLQQDTLMDATLISAPSSTKNQSKQCDPDLRSTTKGNQYYFGMKSHLGVDAQNGLVHTSTSTSVNERDVTQADQLLTGKEVFVFGDSGYIGAQKRQQLKHKDIDWFISKRPSQWRTKANAETERTIERGKAQMRAKVEHIFRIIKCQFGFRKTVYQGLAKNHNKLAMLYTLANLVKVEQIVRRERVAEG